MDKYNPLNLFGDRNGEKNGKNGETQNSRILTASQEISYLQERISELRKERDKHEKAEQESAGERSTSPATRRAQRSPRAVDSRPGPAWYPRARRSSRSRSRHSHPHSRGAYVRRSPRWCTDSSSPLSPPDPRVCSRTRAPPPDHAPRTARSRVWEPSTR